MTPPQEWVQEMWELAKQLDPTRMVEDMSVCHWDHLEYYLHCDTDINSWHFYISDYQKAKAQIDKLTPSILAKAFRGELVPQDPNDEPAERLLERIRAARSAQQSAQRPITKMRSKLAPPRKRVRHKETSGR